MHKYLAQIRKAFLQALADDVMNTSKATAYSAMLMMFPALLVVTTLVAQVQEDGAALSGLRALFEQFLPPDTLDLLQSYVLSQRTHSFDLILSASTIGMLAGLGVMLSLMEGFRRAYRLSAEDWEFWDRRLRALLLLPICLVPLTVATLLIIFGHQIELWMIDNSVHELRYIVLFFWRMIRWSISVATSITVLSLLYHFGTRRKEHWGWVVQGAVAGTLIWFPATVAFGWYVTRIANYSRIYGPFGAGIATLVWLYLTSFSVLLGAELNGIRYCERDRQRNVV